MISDELDNRGVQFLIGEPKEIRVRFTDKGLKEYKKNLFGKDAEILEPKRLRDRFRRMYDEAASVYNGSL